MIVKYNATTLNTTDTQFSPADEMGKLWGGWSVSASAIDMQISYNQSLVKPQIVTNATLWSIQLQWWTWSDSDYSIELLNNAGTKTAWIRSDAVPTISTDLVTKNHYDTVANGLTNALKSATTTVNVSSATAPTTGQVLTATSSTAATWQTPSGWSTQIRKMFAVWWTIWTTWTNIANTHAMDWTYTLQQVNLWYSTAGSGTLTVDVNKNGTTVYATTKPSITSTNQTSINSGTITTAWCVSWDVYTIDVDAVPWTPWTDLFVELVFTS